MSFFPKKFIKNLIGSIAFTQLFVTSSVIAFEYILPDEARVRIANEDNVYILDVRTIAEWKWVGHPGENKLGEGAELNGKVFNIPYWFEIQPSLQKTIWPVENHKFVMDVDKLFGNIPQVILITMCRSGKRSALAAVDLEQAGYAVYSMLDGFEGGKDDRGYHTNNGWKNIGLPYTY